ncbi:MAG: 50S ribosomal protein L25 [Patescibacteria group bacterium]|jgi:large subunit ribosomal protein L25
MTELKAKTREIKDNINKIRREGLIPAVVYSKGEKADNLSINYIQFEKVYEHAGESSLIDLVMEGGQAKKVLIHEIQREPVRNKFLHVDFYEVDLKKKVTAPVEIELVGEAPIVKSEGGIVIKHLDEIEIECLPMDLIKDYKVDISGLDSFDSAIHVKDLKISDKITILDDPDEVVVNVSEPRKEEEAPVAVAEEAAEGAEVKESAEGEEKTEDKKEEEKK